MCGCWYIASGAVDIAEEENGESEEEGGKTEVGIKKKKKKRETWNDSSKTDGWATCLFPGSCINCGADLFCYYYFCVLRRAAVNESPMTRPLPSHTFVYSARQIVQKLFNQACTFSCTSVHFQKLFLKITKERAWSSLRLKCNYGCIFYGRCKNSEGTLYIDFFFYAFVTTSF